MSLKRINKKLEAEIIRSASKLQCPIHSKKATISMPDENKEVIVEACCVFFKKDVFLLGEKMRKDFIYKDNAKRERIAREIRKANNNFND